MDCHTSFTSWFCKYILNMKIISEMDNKFFGLKKKLISILLIAYVFKKSVCLLVIVFVMLYPVGCQHSFVHNLLMVILHVVV